MTPAARRAVFSLPASLSIRCGRRYGTGTPCSTTGGCVGSSSAACDTPLGVIVSTTFGTVAGSTEQIGDVPPTAHTPNA